MALMKLNQGSNEVVILQCRSRSILLDPMKLVFAKKGEFAVLGSVARRARNLLSESS